MILTQEQIDSFHAQGYLSYGRVLDDKELELLRREYDRAFEEASQSGEYRNLAVSDSVDEQMKSSASKKMLQIMQLGERNMHFCRLWYHKTILDIVQDLIGPNIQLLHDQALSKPARTGGAVFWHQDNAYWKCQPANLVSCWLALDDAVKENGAMQVIPGSHLKPIWHTKSESTNALFDLEKTGQVDPKQAVVVSVPAGGCMFHHCQTLHYTQPNETPRQRRAFAIHFMTPGTWSESWGEDGKRIAVGFSHPILRMSI